MRIVFPALCAVWFAFLAALAPARAQDEAAGSYITPFPSGDVYQLLVLGDSLGEGVLDGLVESLGSDTRLQLNRKRLRFLGVMRNEFENDLKVLEEALGKETAHVVVVMFGADDRYPIRSAQGKRVPVGSDEWKAEYSRRIDRAMKLVKKRNAAVYWVGLPNMRRSEANDDAQVMNEAIRERAYLNGMKYVDAYAGFADENGGYSAYGPDLTGKIRLLREPDGIHFTEAGNRKLSHFVERELKRDLTTARNERTIPLLGAEGEQERINPNKARLAAPAGEQKAAAAPQASAAAQQQSPPPAAGAPAAAQTGDIKADNGRFNLRIVGAGGREDVVPMEIVRPAIPASVVALVTRRESADKASLMGDTLVDQIPGGLAVMSSITPASASSGRRRISPTQSPYFRVLVKGERLSPKPGRGDDLPFPRPDTQAALDAPPQPPPQPPPPPAAVPPPPAPQPAARPEPKAPPKKTP